MAEISWHPFENGSTLGHAGSEQGVLTRDEEHPLGARISLERETSVAPFAITCGIYGWMLHTRYFDSEDQTGAQYDAMKSAIADLLEAADKTAEIDGGQQVLMDGVAKFVETFP